MLPVNACVLKERFPVTYRLIQEASKTKQYRLVDNNTGIEIRQEDHTRTVHPCGQEDPQQLSERWAHNCTCSPSYCYALGGFGLGTHIEALLKVAPKDTVFFIAEKDPNWLEEVFCQKDCSHLLKNPRVVLVTDRMDQNYFETLAGFPLYNLKGCGTLSFTPTQTLNTDYYDTLFGQFEQQFSYLKNLHSVNIRDGGLWLATSLRNLRHLIDAPDVIKTKGFFRDLPLVLVAAGPSLDLSIPFLRSIKEHALIVCVNSAYRKLIHSGIKPHITLAADPRLSTFKGYEGCDTTDTFLMCPFFVHPYVVEAFEGRIFTWNTDNYFVSYLRSKLGEDPGTPILEKGTVAACIVDLAKIWGSSKICLVGQDLAIAPNGQSHTKDSYYADNSNLYLKLKDCTMLPGNVQKQVPVHKRLIDFLTTFNQLVQETPFIEYINVSALGAKIRNVSYKSFDEAARWIGKHSGKSVLEMLEGCIRKKQAKDTEARIEHALKPLEAFSQKLLDKCLEAAFCIECLPDKYEEPNYKNNIKIKQCFDYANQVNFILDSYPKEYLVLYHGTGKKELFNYLEKIKKIQTTSLHWKTLLENKEYFWSLAEAAYFTKQHIEYLLHGLPPEADATRVSE